MAAKIDDDTLLQRIWEMQIRKAAKGVLTHYAGGEYGVVRNEDIWRMSATSISYSERHQITSLIGKAQMLNRIKAFFESGMLRLSMHRRAFSVANDEAVKALFEDARHHWLNLGVPTGFDNESQSMRCAPIENYNVKLAQVEKSLYERHFNAMGLMSWLED